jgi:hypothetical protein
MKDTNAIEQAIRDKCRKEISKVVDVFMHELELTLSNKLLEINVEKKLAK